MDRAELYDSWQREAGQGRRNKDRPAWVREHHADLNEHVDTDDLPSPGAPLAAWREWLGRYKGTVTAQLSPDDADSEVAE